MTNTKELEKKVKDLEKRLAQTQDLNRVQDLFLYQPIADADPVQFYETIAESFAGYCAGYKGNSFGAFYMNDRRGQGKTKTSTIIGEVYKNPAIPQNKKRIIKKFVHKAIGENEVLEKDKIKAVPIKINKDVDVVLVTYAEKYRKEKNVNQIIKSAADRSRVKIDDKLKYDNISDIASKDNLTRLALVRPFRDALKTKIGLDKKFNIGIFDIDRFKQFNDIYGHKVGDFVLKLLAHEIKEVLGEKDFIARYGGEEFALIIDGDYKDAKKVYYNLKENLQNLDYTEQLKKKRLKLDLDETIKRFRSVNDLEKIERDYKKATIEKQFDINLDAFIDAYNDANLKKGAEKKNAFAELKKQLYDNFKITLSAGFREYRPGEYNKKKNIDKKMDYLLDDADKASYHVKNNGRNDVAVDGFY